MDVSTVIGSLGVSLLLLSFVLSTFGILSADGKLSAAINLIGAGLSCYSSILIEFLPFVILEGAWAAVAVAGLVRAGR